MRNPHLEVCNVCKGEIPADSGIRTRVKSGWTVIHDGNCPRTKARRAEVLKCTRAAIWSLNMGPVTRDQIDDALQVLREIVHTRWATLESCEKTLLSASAFADMDRLELEDIIQELTRSVSPVSP